MTAPFTIRADNIDKVIEAVWIHADQAKFALANALNRTAEEVNAVLRRELPTRFTIREPALLRYVAPQQLPMHQRATKERLQAMLLTEGMAAVLGPHEEGIPNVRTVRRPVIVPTTSLRPSVRTRIGRQFYPTSLGLLPRHTPKGDWGYALGRGSSKKGVTPFRQGKGDFMTAGWTIQGKLGTFALMEPYHKNLSPGQAGVYQRVGNRVRKLWHYVDRVKRTKNLRFEDTSNRVMAERFGVNFDGALAHALRTAR